MVCFTKWKQQIRPPENMVNPNPSKWDDVNEYFVKPDGQHVPFPPEINKLEASRSTQKIIAK